MNKYLHLTTNEESNIAVIQCDNDGNFTNEQVKKALAEHFNGDILIDSVDKESSYPLIFTVKYSLDIDGDVEKCTAFLNETWVY